MEVLQLICEGYSTKQIAAVLNIRFKTAACHRSSLLSKAGAKNTVALFRWALENGYVFVGRKETRQ
jgi:DNA-binding NarL/FixJ family response regulator